MDKNINKPEVSVIIPAYNALDYIQESIDSVIAQTFTNWELLVIDDGSTDGTSGLIKDYCNRDKRIKYFHQENGKQGKARNIGIANAKGIYIAFLDADDFWMPEKLKIQLEIIQLEKADLVFSDCYMFHDNNVLDRTIKKNIPNITLKGNEALELFLQANRIPILTVLVKKEKILLVHAFSEKSLIQNAEDYHLWLKLLISGCVFYGSKKTLASYRIHSKSVTNNNYSSGNKKIEVFFDLLNSNTGVKIIMLKALKKEFINEYKGRLYSKLDLSIMIDKNCLYIHKQRYLFFYKFLNFFFATKITKRLLIYLLNG
ncbi:MAG: glycosyltransferase [Flavobacterium sp.]|nr:glycosyltransferase [Flavobacterium sp.]